MTKVARILTRIHVEGLEKYRAWLAFCRFMREETLDGVLNHMEQTYKKTHGHSVSAHWPPKGENNGKKI